MVHTSIGIVGLGYWGPNWLRNFASLEGAELRWGCDLDPERITKFARQYPATRFTQNFDDLINDPSLDAIVIATPTASHFPLALKALRAGKHVLIEKPMTSTAHESKKLLDASKKAKKLILADHTFAYTSAVQKMADLVHEKKIGELLYFDSTRLNLGLIQKDCNVLWDLAIHDLTILSCLTDLSAATDVLAIGRAHFGKHVEDAHLHLTLKGGLAAHIHVSWLSPVKVRSTFVAGRKAMIVYDDTEPSEKIRLYDKGVDHDDTKPDPFFPKYRSGDVLIPALPVTEALAVEAVHFIDCIRGKNKPLVSGDDGLCIIKILEMADESLKKGKVIKAR